MAFNSNTAARSNNIPDAQKAVSYINLYLPNQGGGKRKLGAVVLRAGYPNEVTLSDWLQADPKNVEHLLSKLIIEVNSATPSADSQFDLS